MGATDAILNILICPLRTDRGAGRGAKVDLGGPEPRESRTRELGNSHQISSQLKDHSVARTNKVFADSAAPRNLCLGTPTSIHA